jgi:hypothetical protein
MTTAIIQRPTPQPSGPPPRPRFVRGHMPTNPNAPVPAPTLPGQPVPHKMYNQQPNVPPPPNPAAPSPSPNQPRPTR